jgi:hypothetical protein
MKCGSARPAQEQAARNCTKLRVVDANHNNFFLYFKVLLHVSARV